MRIKYDQFMAEGSLIVLEGAVLNMMDVYEDLDNHIQECGYDVRCLGFDPYNAKEFVARWESENGPFGIEKVIQGAKTESVPLGELKKLQLPETIFLQRDLGCLWRATPITSLMKKLFRIERGTTGRCLVLSVQTYRRATTSAHLHSCSLCQTVLLVLRHETILPLPL